MAHQGTLFANCQSIQLGDEVGHILPHPRCAESQVHRPGQPVAHAAPPQHSGIPGPPHRCCGLINCLQLCLSQPLGPTRASSRFGSRAGWPKGCSGEPWGAQHRGQPWLIRQVAILDKQSLFPAQSTPQSGAMGKSAGYAPRPETVSQGFPQGTGPSPGLVWGVWGGLAHLPARVPGGQGHPSSHRSRRRDPCPRKPACSRAPPRTPTHPPQPTTHFLLHRLLFLIPAGPLPSPTRPSSAHRSSP